MEDPPAKAAGEQDQSERLGALYNRRIMAFLDAQLEKVRGVEAPPNAGKKDVANFELTVEKGKRLVAKHGAVFDVRDYYSILEACTAVEEICACLKEVLEEWGMQAAASIMVTIPPKCVEEDEDHLRRFLTYILKDGKCTVEGKVAQRWMSSKKRHEENMRLLHIIDEGTLRLGKKLGKGSQGAVYKAVWQCAQVAVKTSLRGIGDDLPIEELAELLKEVMIHATLRSHPNIVQLLATTTSGWMVMELAQSDLHALCHSGVGLAWSLKNRLLSQGAAGLAYIHAQNRIHGDVKPQNFLVFGTCSEEYKVKVSDFGMGFEAALSRNMTVRMGGGTPQWIAPEIYDNKPITQASDVYSFGAVCYEVVAQSHLYEGVNEYAIMAMKCSGKEPCPVAPEDCPPQMLELMRQCCARNPKARPTMKEVYNILLQLSEECHGKDNSPIKVPSTSSVDFFPQLPRMLPHTTARDDTSAVPVPVALGQALGAGQLMGNMGQNARAEVGKAAASADYFKILLQKVADEAKNMGGCTTLHAASMQGQAQVVEWLLLTGAAVNVPNKDGNTPLHSASQGGSKEVVELLLRNGADVGCTRQDGFTPLHCASYHGRKEVVECLVQNGTDVNFHAKNGSTPLLCASQGGTREMVEFLLQNGADTGCTLKNGCTPLHCASQGGKKEIVEFFLQNGADVRCASQDGYTPLHCASQNGDKETIAFLLDNGADVCCTKKGGYTPLHCACHNGKKAAVEFLLEHGAGVCCRTKDGSTPLIVAAKWGRRQVVELLVEKGAHVRQKDKEGKTAFDWAQQNGHWAVVDYLGRFEGRASSSASRIKETALSRLKNVFKMR